MINVVISFLRQRVLRVYVFQEVYRKKHWSRGFRGVDDSRTDTWGVFESGPFRFRWWKEGDKETDGTRLTSDQQGVPTAKEMSWEFTTEKREGTGNCGNPDFNTVHQNWNNGEERPILGWLFRVHYSDIRRRRKPNVNRRSDRRNK